jgi:hypothetical protein
VDEQRSWTRRRTKRAHEAAIRRASEARARVEQARERAQAAHERATQAHERTAELHEQAADSTRRSGSTWKPSKSVQRRARERGATAGASDAGGSAAAVPPLRPRHMAS